MNENWKTLYTSALKQALFTDLGDCYPNPTYSISKSATANNVFSSGERQYTALTTPADGTVQYNTDLTGVSTTDGSGIAS